MEVKTVSTGQLTLPAPVRFWSQFLNGGLTTASTENQRFGFRFVFFSKPLLRLCQLPLQACGAQMQQETPRSWSKLLLPRPLALLVLRRCATGLPLPQSPGCALSSVLLQEQEREKAWGLAYNKESLVTMLSGKSRGTRSPFSGNSPLAPGPLRGGTLAKERCPYNCNPVQLLAFPIYLECALCFQSPSIYYV